VQIRSPRSPMREGQDGVRRSWRRRAFGSCTSASRPSPKLDFRFTEFSEVRIAASVNADCDNGTPFSVRLDTEGMKDLRLIA
jgi:hypothetical protein